MLSCSIWFSEPSFWMGGGLESCCIDRVYGVDDAVRLLMKSNHLIFTRAHTHTSWSLPRYFRSDHVDNAFATNVIYSVGHLTSIL